MIRHILTLIWNQRRSNVWIFLELLLVAAILWVVTDALVVDLYTYHRPLGLDTRNMPFVLLILLNLLVLDIPDTYRMAYTGWRFALAFGGTYVLLGLMIYLGISIPAKQILRMNPADTLHYE